MPKDKVPEEYIDYFLMKQFRCLPSELDKEDQKRLMSFIAINNIVIEAQQHEQKRQLKKQHGNKRAA